ncbi:bile acid sodium symporter (plasmid) [Caballeronia cordobensis]|nr:bile acid sodium symporter [Burkholderia sp. RPE67]
MNARRRQAARRNWPENLYQNTTGYLWFKNPMTGRTLGLGHDLDIAIKKVKRANLELARMQEEQNLIALTSEGRKTLADHCVAYEEEYTKGKKKNTETAIKSQLKAIRQDSRSAKPIDQFSPKDAADLIKDAEEIVIGLVVNHFFGKLVRKIEWALPLVSMVSILLIIAAVVGGTQKSIASVGMVVAVGVVLHNGIGLLGGYWGGRLLGFDEAVCRTLAIEVGMQNSGLAATLGKLYFTPIAALPGALFSVWHNLSGSMLAGYWSSKRRLAG